MTSEMKRVILVRGAKQNPGCHMKSYEIIAGKLRQVDWSMNRSRSYIFWAFFWRMKRGKKKYNSIQFPWIPGWGTSSEVITAFTWGDALRDSVTVWRCDGVVLRCWCPKLKFPTATPRKVSPELRVFQTPRPMVVTLWHVQRFCRSAISASPNICFSKFQPLNSSYLEHIAPRAVCVRRPFWSRPVMVELHKFCPLFRRTEYIPMWYFWSMSPLYRPVFSNPHSTFSRILVRHKAAFRGVSGRPFLKLRLFLRCGKDSFASKCVKHTFEPFSWPVTRKKWYLKSRDSPVFLAVFWWFSCERCRMSKFSFLNVHPCYLCL